MSYFARYGADNGGGYNDVGAVDILNPGHYIAGGDVWGLRFTVDGGNSWWGCNQGFHGSFPHVRAAYVSKRAATSGLGFFGTGILNNTASNENGGLYGVDLGSYNAVTIDGTHGFGQQGFGKGAGNTASNTAKRPSGDMIDGVVVSGIEYVFTVTTGGVWRYTNAGAGASAVSGPTQMATAADITVSNCNFFTTLRVLDRDNIIVISYDRNGGGGSAFPANQPVRVFLLQPNTGHLDTATGTAQVDVTTLTHPVNHIYDLKKGKDGVYYAACGFDGIYSFSLSGTTPTWTHLDTPDNVVSSVDADSAGKVWAGQAGGAADYSNDTNMVSKHGVRGSNAAQNSWSYPIATGTVNKHFFKPGDGASPSGSLWWLAGEQICIDGNAYDCSQIRVDPFNDNKILLFGRTGTWQTRDGGATWAPATYGFNGAEVDAVRTYPSVSPTRVISGNLVAKPSGNNDYGTELSNDLFVSATNPGSNSVIPGGGNGKGVADPGSTSIVGDDGQTYVFTASTGSGGANLTKNGVAILSGVELQRFKGAIAHPTGIAVSKNGTVFISQFGGGTFVVDPTGGGPPPPPAPVITSFTPATAAVGATVTVNGTDFTGATSVQVNGTSAGTFTVVSSIKLTFVVPSGATTGVIRVTTPNGFDDSSTSLVVATAVAPVITSFAPGTAAFGASVVLTGTTFTGATSVKIGTVPVSSFTVNSSTSVTFGVPTSAVTAKPNITTPGGSGTASTSLVVTSPVAVPTITSFSPGTASVGDSIAVVGTNFDVANSVKANGTSASFTQTGGTAIAFAVPSGATTGRITVASAGGTATSGSNLTVNTVGGGADPFVRRLDQQAPTGAGTAVTLTIPTGGVPVGHNVVLIAGSNHIAVTGVVDSKSNVYQNDASVLPGTATAAGMWSAPVTTALAVADTITVTYASSVSGRSAVAAEYQYFAASSYNDTAYTSSASGTAFTFTSDVRTPTPTTAQANEVVVTGLVIGGSGASSGAVTSGNSFIKRGSIENASGTQRNVALADRTLTATGHPAVNWTWAVASGFSEVTTAYKINPPGGGGGTGVAPTIAQDTRISALQTASTRTFPAWPNPTLAGSRIVVIIGITDGGHAGIGVSVSGGGTYQKTAKSPAIQFVSSVAQESLREYHLLNANAGAPSPTLTFTGLPGAGANVWAIAFEVKGSHPTLLEDTSDTDNQSRVTGIGQTVTLGPVGPTTNDGVLWLAAFHSGDIDAVRLASGSSFFEYAFANQATPASAAKWAYLVALKSQTLASSAETASATIAGGVNHNYAALMTAIPAGTGTGGGGGGGGGVTLPDTNDGRGHFARSGHYYPAITSGNSRTALQNALWISARNDIVITNADENNSGLITGDKYSGFAPEMRASNPDIVLSIYGKGPQIAEGANFFPNTYYAHQTPWPTGAKIASAFSASILRAQPFSSDQPNFADPRGFTATSFRDYRAKDAQSIIDDYNTRDGTGTINSWFFDSCGANCYSTLIADPLHPTQTYQAAYADGRTAYLDLVDTIIDSTVTLLGDGYLVIANGLGSGAGYYNNLSRLLSHAHIGWAESWMHRNYTTPANAYPIEADWQASIDMLVHANETLSKGVMVTTNIANDTAGSAPAGWVAWTTAQTNQLRRFTFASYMLGKRDQSWYEFVPSAPGGDYVEDDSYYHVDLGAPLDNPPVSATTNKGAALAMKQPGGVYRRRYTFGTVYVNPTTATVTFTLDQDYNTVASDGSNSGVAYGIAGASKTLAAHDAVIVYLDNTTITNTSAPVGTIISPIGTVSTPDVNFVVSYTDPDGDGIASAQARNFTAGTAYSPMIPQGANWSLPLTLSAGANVLQTKATDNNASPMTSSPLAGTVTYTAATTPAPVNSVAPSIPVDLTVGVTFTIDPGVWSNTPSVFTYTLKSRPAAGGTFATVQTSTLPQYTPVLADAGFVFRASVIASNSVATGSSVDSNTSNPVPLPPDVTLVVAEE